jgi:nitrate reductase NapE
MAATQKNMRERRMRVEQVDVGIRWKERLLFFFLAVVIWPFIAVGVVAGWGLLVWTYYMFTGPPGPV